MKVHVYTHIYTYTFTQRERNPIKNKIVKNNI